MRGRERVYRPRRAPFPQDSQLSAGRDVHVSGHLVPYTADWVGCGVPVGCAGGGRVLWAAGNGGGDGKLRFAGWGGRGGEVVVGLVGWWGRVGWGHS